MVQVLTNEQSEYYQAKYTIGMYEWFNTLSFEEKRIIHDQYKTIFKQIKCSHTGRKNPFYDRFTCSDCGYLLP